VDLSIVREGQPAQQVSQSKGKFIFGSELCAAVNGLDAPVRFIAFGSMVAVAWPRFRESF
jgi:hypothetical protein